jgi:hypothetical protein
MPTCSYCQAPFTDGPLACPSCGKPPTGAQSAESRPGSAKQGVMNNLWSSSSVNTRTLGIATLIVFIAMFLPWYSASALGFTVTVNGLTRWGWLTFLGMLLAAVAVAALIRADLAARALRERILILRSRHGPTCSRRKACIIGCEERHRSWLRCCPPQC